MGCPRPFPERCSQLWWLLYLIEQVQAEGLLSTARPVVWEQAEAMLYFYIPDPKIWMCFYVHMALHIAYRPIGSDVVGYWWHGCRQSSCTPGAFLVLFVRFSPLCWHKHFCGYLGTESENWSILTMTKRFLFKITSTASQMPLDFFEIWDLFNRW